MHQTVASGKLDPHHNAKVLEETPMDIRQAFEANQHGTKDIAEALGYEDGV